MEKRPAATRAVLLVLVALTAVVATPLPASAAASAPNPADPPAGVGNSSSQIETVVVTARRYREKALDIKKSAPNVIEVQPVQEIRKLPDVNVAEALQRLPGISLEADTGEGRFVNIRGMDADLNGTAFDGVILTASNQSSPQGGARAVAFDAFPTGAIGSIEIIKSLTPEMDAEGLGGVINLLPRGQTGDENPFLDAAIGSGYEPLRQRPVWQGDITAGTTFDADGNVGNAGPFGVLGTYTLEEDHRGVDDVEEGYSLDPLPLGTPEAKLLNNLQLRWYEYHRTRQGAAGGFTWSPNDSNAFFVRIIQAGYDEAADKHHLELDSLDAGTTYDNTTTSFDAPTAQAFQTFTDSNEHVGNDLVMFGGRSLVGILTADYRGAWTGGYDNFSRNWSGGFMSPTLPKVYNNIRSAAYPSFAAPLNLADHSLYTFADLSNTPTESFDQEWSGATDFSFPLDAGDVEGKVKFGARVRLRERGVNQDQITYSPNIPSLAGLTTGTNQIYYDHHYNIGPSLNTTAIEALRGAPSDPAGDAIANLQAFENDNENVYAGYVQYSATHGALSILGGVRYEATVGTYLAYLSTTDANGNVVLTPNTNRQDYTDFFPSLQSRYNLDDQTVLRAAFSTAIARPGFNQITAAESVDKSGFPNVVISLGNPALKPTTGDSFDATLEHYMPNGGLAAAGVFYKYFENYIIPTTAIVANSFGGQTMTGSFANIATSFAEGTELDYIQQFAFLPEPFDGLGFDGNLTLVYAKGNIRTNPVDHTTLPQTSPFNYNAELFYEKGPYGIRLAAAFVSRNIFAVGPDPTLDVYSTPRFRLDLGTTYDITENIQFYFDAKNLTNTLLEFTRTKSTFFPIQREFYGPTFFAGLRIQLGEAGFEKLGLGDDD